MNRNQVFSPTIRSASTTSRRKKAKFSSTYAKAAKEKQPCINPKCGRLVINMGNHFQQSPQCLEYLNELNKAKTPNPQQRRSQRLLTRDKLCPNNKSNSTTNHDKTTEEDDEAVFFNIDIDNDTQNQHQLIDTHTSNVSTDIPDQTCTFIDETGTNNTHQQLGHNSTPFDLREICNTLDSSKRHTVFSKQTLISIKLFQILHKSQAPISLYDEIAEFIENTQPILASFPEKSKCIVRRETLLKQCHDHIIFKNLDTRNSDHVNRKIISRKIKEQK